MYNNIIFLNNIIKCFMKLLVQRVIEKLTYFSETETIQ